MSGGGNIIKNLASMTAAEGVSKAAVFIYTIYLARIFGADGFGIFGFATAFTSYFLVMMNLGFDAYGARETAKDNSQIPFLANSIVSLRLFLSVILFILFIGIVIALDKPDNVKIVLVISGLNIFGNALNLYWVYQGIEKMGVIALRMIITSLLNLAGIFIFVHSPNDIAAATAVITASFTIGQFWILSNYIKEWKHIKLRIDFKVWLNIVKASVPIGLSFVIIQLYNNTDMVMLGFLRTDVETGLYNAAHKILLLSVLPGSIIQSVFYPNLSKRKTYEERSQIMEKYTALTFSCGLFISGIFAVFAEYIILNSFSDEFAGAVIIMRLLMFTSLTMYLCISFSIPLIAWDLDKKVLIAIASGGITNILLNALLIPYFGTIGAALATIASEIMVLTLLVFSFYKLMNRLFLDKFAQLAGFAAASCLAAIALLFIGVNELLSAAVALGIFVLLILFFKIVPISLIKEYLKK